MNNVRCLIQMHFGCVKGPVAQLVLVTNANI